jgi:hypothetical protein
MFMAGVVPMRVILGMYVAGSIPSRRRRQHGLPAVLRGLGAVDRFAGGRDLRCTTRASAPGGPPVYGNFLGFDPVVVGGIVAFGAVVRLVALIIALRGAAPGERPAIIRALAEFFHVLPRRRR